MSRANPRTTHDNAGIAAWRFKMLAGIHSYEDCARAFAELVKDGEAIVGPQMKLIDRLGAEGKCGYAVVLYDTEIIRYYPDGSFSVDNGGFNTPTTSARLNAVLPSGYKAFHHQKLLGLYPSGRSVLAPLDHSKRIKDGEILP